MDEEKWIHFRVVSFAFAELLKTLEDNEIRGYYVGLEDGELTISIPYKYLQYISDHKHGITRGNQTPTIPLEKYLNTVVDIKLKNGGYYDQAYFYTKNGYYFVRKLGVITMVNLSDIKSIDGEEIA